MSVFNTEYAQTQEQFEKLLSRRLDRCKNQANRKLLDNHIELKEHKVEPSTLGAQAEILAFWMMHLQDKPALDATAEDFKAYFRGRRGCGQNTNYHHFVVIRGFYRDLTEQDKPPQVGKFSIPRPEVEALTPSDLISEEDLVKLLKVCDNEMERCIVMVLYSVGFRNGELCALDTNSVVVDDTGEMTLCLPKYASGLKTGPRDCLVFAPTDHYVKEWLKQHEKPAAGKTPLFYYRRKDGKLHRINQSWMTYFTRRLNDRAGLTKLVWPHLFRHTAATNMSKRNVHFLTMCEYFGWQPTSEMPAYYSHLAQSTHHDNLRVAHGKSKRETKTVGIQMLKCGKCSTENVPTAVFCQQCNRPLSPEAVKQMQDRQQEELNRLVATQIQEKLRAAGVLVNLI